MKRYHEYTYQPKTLEEVEQDFIKHGFGSLFQKYRLAIMINLETNSLFSHQCDSLAQVFSELRKMNKEDFTFEEFRDELLNYLPF